MSRTHDPSQLNDHIQQLVDGAASGHIRSVVLGVQSDDGSVRIRAAAGAAKPDDAYYIASISKIITASMVMQLVDEGRLDLSHRVVDLLPHLRLDGVHRHDGTDHTERLEARHLLHQTSGLADYFAGGFEDDFKANRDRPYTVADVVDIARGNDANFPPGDRDGRRSAYSDTNYQLLTAIIENVTGDTYGDAVQKRIAAPLGLEHTYVEGDVPTSSSSRPVPLRHNGRPLDLRQALASERGAGGIISTLDDQLQFSAAYHQGRLFDSAHADEMQRWNRLFFPVDYGYGVMRYRLPRWVTGFRQLPELIGHAGASNSFTFFVPELGCHIAGTLNDLDNPSRAFKLMMKVVGTIRKAQRQ